MATTSAQEQAIRDGLAQFRMAGIIGEVDVPMRRTYVRGLSKVDSLVIRESVERLLSQAGRRFQLTLPEWLGVCATIVDERRAHVARIAQSLQDDCPQCMGSGWANTEGPNAVVRCTCRTRALELMAQAIAPIARPALPASTEESA
jgi:hypothetical protein